MQIAIVGATGNAGTALLRRLQRVPVIDEIAGIARRAPDRNTPPYDGVSWHPIDIGADDAPAKLDAAFEGASAVVHLGWAIQPNHDERVLYRTNITGTEHVLAAAARANMNHVVYASSVGAYSPAPKDRRIDEQWPTGGIHTSHYSRHKAAVERILDRFESEHADIVVSRLRPGLIFQGDNGSEVGRYFLGPLVPKGILNKLKLPALTIPEQMLFQAVHADDVADAYWRVLERRAGGAFNIAAEPVLTPPAVAGIIGAKRALPLPFNALRTLAAVTWKLRLQRSDPGWLDMAAQAPIMSTDRARTVLGWRPRFSSEEAMETVIEGLGEGQGIEGSPPLKPRD